MAGCGRTPWLQGSGWQFMRCRSQGLGSDGCCHCGASASICRKTVCPISFFLRPVHSCTSTIWYVRHLRETSYGDSGGTSDLTTTHDRPVWRRKKLNTLISSSPRIAIPPATAVLLDELNRRATSPGMKSSTFKEHAADNRSLVSGGEPTLRVDL